MQLVRVAMSVILNVRETVTKQRVRRQLKEIRRVKKGKEKRKGK